ncbi:MAG: cyclodeaminase/cyclohydrolase family protein [Firmicutes bacterium]|nr:cyclodeaminase/cyclohydrolase family protein [Bacillota bacterium]
MELRHLTLTDFVRELGSNSPAPGGGSVAALASAQSAALFAMVAELTAQSPKYTDVKEEMEAMARELHALQDHFLEEVDNDANSFNGVMAAFRMPKDTDEEKQARREKIQAEYKNAANVPYGVGARAAELTKYAPILLEKGNTNAITDLGLGVHNLRMAVVGAFYNVKINLGSIKDQAYVEEKKSSMATILAKVEEETRPIIQAVEEAIA